MAVNFRTPTGYIEPECFTQVAIDHYQYTSPAPERAGKIYNIRYINGRWTCECPSARALHKVEQRCKHEVALCQRIAARKAAASQPEREAEQIITSQEERGELAALRAEVVELHQAQTDEIWTLRTEIANLRSRLYIQSQQQPAQAAAPDLTAILAELAALRAENTEIKSLLATKATARKRHASEQETAEAKKHINCILDNAVEAANSAIACAEMARRELKDLEVIPYELKKEIDQLVENGQAPFLAADYVAPELPDEIRKSVRDAQEEISKRNNGEGTPINQRDSDAQEAARLRRKRENAPLNGNAGFTLYK